MAANESGAPPPIPVGKVTFAPTSGTKLDLRRPGMDEDQFAQLTKAIVVSGVISGMLASGRIPNSPENKRTLESAITIALELLK